MLADLMTTQIPGCSAAVIPLPRRISKSVNGRLANRQQHRIEETDEVLLCAKQTCLKLTVMQPEQIEQSRAHRRISSALRQAPSPEVMQLCFIPVFVLTLLGCADSWGPGGKYAVNCPDKCSPVLCGSTHRCRRTVLDDCGCCPVCAAARGEHCYRTVSAVHGVKCGPGLFCDFYKDEDDYGDEYGICRDCMYGTFGLECRETCKCKAGGLCDRETGACLSFKLLTEMTRLKSLSSEGNDLGSGDQVSDVDRSSSTGSLLPPR